ncbi:YdcF family protein [Paenibacillus massiliensis]|uniref:YdcF family protein n=1 Tax=Paenibacillus massiliensis TaxID=225917 RepID=UPI0004070933|nr:YdcF family protein [Paenibacillus massiliensis]
MIYLIKWLYSFVLPPGLFVILLLGISIWIWKKQRRAAITLLGVTVLLYASMIPLTGDLLVGTLERQYAQPQETHGDIIVVLGGGATQGTPDLDGEGNMLGSAANRLLTAARLYEQTGLPILFSGGQVFPDSGNEADIARRQLLGLGVPPQNIYTENRSLNTEQNASYSAFLLQEEGFQRPILITSAFHLPRAVLQFERAGIEVTPFPTDYLASQPQHWYAGKFSPSPGASSVIGTAFKEYLGIAALKLKD